MIRKVSAGAEFKRAAGTVTKALARWLAQKGYVAEQAAAESAGESARVARDLPAAETMMRRRLRTISRFSAQSMGKYGLRQWPEAS